MAILSALILLLFSVVDGTSKVWNRSEQRVDAFREARAALFIIARDLQSTVPAPDLVNETLTPTDAGYGTPNGIPDFKYFFINQPLASAKDVTFTGATEAKYGGSLFFMTAQPASAQFGGKSDVCLAGYYLDYTGAVLQSGQAEMAGSSASFKLYRYFQNSDQSFDRIKNYAPSATGLPPLYTAGSSTGDEVLARNVVNFHVVAYDADFKVLDTSATAPGYGTTTPYAIDLSITAYNYSTARLFENKDAWLDFTSSKNAPARQEFSTRVYLSRHATPTPTPTATP